MSHSLKARNGKPNPLCWRKADGEHHADIKPGWGISICQQPTHFIWFVEVEEAQGVAIAACGSDETLTAAKKRSAATASATMASERKPRPKHYGARVKCLACGSIIQSKHRHDFTSCRCGALSIDGGGEYCRMIGTPGGFEQVTPGHYFIK